MELFTYKVQGLFVTIDPTVKATFCGGTAFAEFFQGLYAKLGKNYTYFYRGNINSFELSPCQIKSLLLVKVD